MISQTNISKETAKKLLRKHKGDIVSSIIDFESGIEEKISIEEKDDNEEIVDVKNLKNLAEYREIVDEKDTIYQKKQDDKEKEQLILYKIYVMKKNIL